MARSLPTLRTFYYLDHFKEMVAFLERHHAGVMGEEERKYLEEFHRLGQQAQGLKVRMTNRRGRIFRIEALNYAEIPDRAAALEELSELGFVRPIRETDRVELLALLTRAELVNLLKSSGALKKGELNGAPKPQIFQLACARCDFEHLTALFPSSSFVTQERTETLDFLLFLYFGKSRDSLQAFALRDLGIVKTKSEQTQFEVRFKSHAMARSAFFYSSLSGKISLADEDELIKIALSAEGWPTPVGRETKAMFHREIAQLGGRLERL